MTCFNPNTLKALEATASTAAAYLDVCDAGAHNIRLDPAYYQACGAILAKIFSLFDPDKYFPHLLRESQAAREVAESLRIGHRIELSRIGFYPQLAVVLNRVSA